MFLNERTGTLHKINGNKTACNRNMNNGKFVFGEPDHSRHCMFCFPEMGRTYHVYPCKLCGKKFNFFLPRRKKAYVCNDCMLSKTRSHTLPIRAKQTVTKNRLLKKRGRKCEQCGRGGKVEMHHIKHVADGGDNSESNLILLCKPCHRKAHS